MLLTCARVFVVTLLLATFAMADDAWTECKVSQGKVSFPSTPSYKLSTDKSPVGTLTTHNWEYNSQGLHLVANTVKLPSVALIFAGPEDIYQDAADALVQDARAKQLSYEKVQISGHDGAQVTYQFSDGSYGRARFVLVDDTLLTTVATWPGSGTPQQVDKFFASLATK